jgi:hypothetical protein
MENRKKERKKINMETCKKKLPPDMGEHKLQH